jgi:hypothetical protein
MYLLMGLLHPDPRKRTSVDDCEKDLWVNQPIDVSLYRWEDVLKLMHFIVNTLLCEHLGSPLVFWWGPLVSVLCFLLLFEPVLCLVLSVSGLSLQFSLIFISYKFGSNLSKNNTTKNKHLNVNIQCKSNNQIFLGFFFSPKFCEILLVYKYCQGIPETLSTRHRMGSNKSKKHNTETKGPHQKTRGEPRCSQSNVLTIKCMSFKTSLFNIHATI